MRKDEVPAENMDITLTFKVPKDLDGLVRYRIFKKFRPFHNKFLQVVKQELRKAGYVPIRNRKEG